MSEISVLIDSAFLQFGRHQANASQDRATIPNCWPQLTLPDESLLPSGVAMFPDMTGIFTDFIKKRITQNRNTGMIHSPLGLDLRVSLKSFDILGLTGVFEDQNTFKLFLTSQQSKPYRSTEPLGRWIDHKTIRKINVTPSEILY